jgi:hypothetical protein
MVCVNCDMLSYFDGSNGHQNITFVNLLFETGQRDRSWLRHYAISPKVAGSIPDVIGFFDWPNPSSRTMALPSTQPLPEMSTRNIPRGKGLPARKAENLTAISEQIA